MVQSSAETVDEYLAELEPERRTVIARLRSTVRSVLPDLEETMQYGMPTYRRSGAPVLAFASQRQYVALFPGVAVVAAHRTSLAPYLAGKGCVRFRRLDRVDWVLVETLVRAAGE
jgi:uncharacterized protein YdhG (YjbR/CyaY superfamily)